MGGMYIQEQGLLCCNVWLPWYLQKQLCGLNGRDKQQDNLRDELC